MDFSSFTTSLRIFSTIIVINSSQIVEERYCRETVPHIVLFCARKAPPNTSPQPQSEPRQKHCCLKRLPPGVLQCQLAPGPTNYYLILPWLSGCCTLMWPITGNRTEFDVRLQLRTDVATHMDTGEISCFLSF